MKAFERRLTQLEKNLRPNGEESPLVIITNGHMPEECLEKLYRQPRRPGVVYGFITPASGEPCPVCGQVHEREKINNIGEGR